MDFLEVVSGLDGFDFVCGEMRCECCGFDKGN